MTVSMNKKLLVLAVGAAATLSGCGGDSSSNRDDGAGGGGAAPLTRLATIPLGAEVTGVEVGAGGDVFFNVQHPSDTLPGDENKAAVGVWAGVNINELPADLESVSVPDPESDDAKTTRVAMGSYQVLGREGDDYAGGIPFGLGNITNADGDAAIKQSNNPDYNAFIASNDDGSEGYLFTAWEDRPGGVTRMSLARNGDDWMVNDAMNIDFSDVNGTMINCFGSVTPWGTPMTSEENYEAENTQHWNDDQYSGGYPNYADVKKIQDYLGGTYPNPYDYGYIAELTQPQSAAPVPVKHFSMGRFAHENPVIMPDEKTVYLTDDGGNKGFYKFIADTAGDLSAGTLYAAKVVQDETDDSSTAGFDISWIELANASNADIEGWIREYDGIDEGDYVADETSYISDEDIAAWANGEAADDRVAFLETLKAAAAKGATVEFNKMEGININLAGAESGEVPFMYVGMADVAGSMADEEGDIQVTENRCGIVYRFPLEANYNVSRMEPAVVGGPYNGSATGDRCSVNNIAQPDNVLVLDDGRLLIGEDSGNHINNMLWVYSPGAE
jgi:uncharacterized protein